MKAVISQQDLLEAINKLQNIVPMKPAIPILSNILIEALDDQLILSATDLITSMKCFLEAKVIEEGAITLPGRKFFQLTRELISPQIKISNLGNDIAEIISGSSIFKINGINKQDFPKIPENQSQTQLYLEPSALKEMLNKSSFSAARNDKRPFFNGINLKIQDKNITFLATDGKRLSRISSQINPDSFFQGSFIIPIKAAEEMVKTLDEFCTKAIISFTDDKFFLESNNTIISTKLISGPYPDIEKVIPKKPKHTIPLNREEMISILRQVALFTSEKTNSVKFIIAPGKLELSINSLEVGEGNVSVDIDYQKETINIAFNPIFFIDALRHTKDETVHLSLIDSYNPGVITDSSSASFVLMPMRLVEKENDHKEPIFT